MEKTQNKHNVSMCALHSEGLWLEPNQKTVQYVLKEKTTGGHPYVPFPKTLVNYDGTRTGRLAEVIGEVKCDVCQLITGQTQNVRECQTELHDFPRKSVNRTENWHIK
jgi:hypothetical protein